MQKKNLARRSNLTSGAGARCVTAESAAVPVIAAVNISETNEMPILSDHSQSSDSGNIRLDTQHFIFSIFRILSTGCP